MKRWSCWIKHFCLQKYRHRNNVCVFFWALIIHIWGKKKNLILKPTFISISIINIFRYLFTYNNAHKSEIGSYFGLGFDSHAVVQTNYTLELLIWFYNILRISSSNIFIFSYSVFNSGAQFVLLFGVIKLYLNFYGEKLFCSSVI